jgi:thiamine-monophosphate kinase
MDRPLGAEQGLIDAALARLGAARGGAVIVGPGDDCAVLDLSSGGVGGAQASSAGSPPRKAAGGRRISGATYALTTDTYVEGVHFSLRHGSLADAGYRALMGNLSDLAAVGALPRWGLAQCGVPRGETARAVELFDGVAEANADARADCGGGIALIGGDTFSAPQWIIGFTLIGELSGPPLLRGGARPGDNVWVSGEPGLAQVGLHALHGDLPGYEAAKAAHLRPRARLKLGQWLRSQGLASACIDLSDSLSQCLLLLAESSGVGLSLDLSKLRLHDEAAAFCEEHRMQAGRSRYQISIPAKLCPGAKALRYASAGAWLLDSAEDYELLFTAPPRSTPALLRESPVPMSLLGTVAEAGEGRLWRVAEGRSQPLKAGGYKHFG